MGMTDGRPYVKFLNGIQNLLNNVTDGSIPFIDTLVTCEKDRTLSTTVYRKATRTEQYLQWNIH